MPGPLAEFAAGIVYRLLVWLMTNKPDDWFVKRGRQAMALMKRLGRPANEMQPLFDIVAIFETGGEGSAIARRFILEAEPAVFRSVLRGAFTK